MFSIEQSVFLQALGKAIGNSLWQVAVLWMTYNAISNIGRLSANRRYQLATAASLTSFVWFIGTLIYAYVTAPQHTAVSPIYTESASGAGDSTTEYLLFIYHSAAASLRSLAPYISCAYLPMFVLLSIRLGNGFRQIKTFATQGLGKADIDLRLYVQRYTAELGINREVRIFTSEHVQSPLTLGFWKPVILLPIASLNHLTVAQVESILLHELAHIRRHDYLINILLQVSEICLFFNPFMRLLLKHVKQERENSCDDYVLQFQYCPKDYAKALLAIEHSNNSTLLALAAKGNQSFQLLNRVKRMVAPQPKAFNYRQQLGLLALLTILTLAITVIVPHPKKASAKKQAVTESKKAVQQIALQEMPINISVKELQATKTPPPAAQQCIDLVKTFIHPNELEAIVNEKVIQENIAIVEKSAAQIEAYGNEVGERVIPFTKKIEDWADGLPKNEDWTKTGAMQVKLDELKNIATNASFNWNEIFDKNFTNNINTLLKDLPVVIGKEIEKENARNKQRKLAAIADSRRDEAALDRHHEIVRQQQANRNNMALRLAENILNKQALKEELAALQREDIQAHLKELQIKEEARQKLHLGLLTDDRDSTINGLLAKVQNLRFKKFPVPPNIFRNINTSATQQHFKGNFKITVPDEDFDISTEYEIDTPVNFHVDVDGQNIDIRHEKQLKNGKEEKVVIIKIDSSK